MSFVTLVNRVFRYGCGMSMHTVMHEIEDFRKHENGSHPELPDDTALTALLGAKLADRAFLNVPWKLRKRIGEWNGGVESQLQLLRDICEELKSWRWRQTGRRTYQYNSDVRSVLPASMGSWRRGRIQANCLGIAQKTVGLARAVGAPHWLANVVQANQDMLLRCKIQALKTVKDRLEQFPDFGEYAAKVEQAYWKTLEHADTPQQAHHLLVIQLADSSWWVVDPYLSALYPLKKTARWETSTNWLRHDPDRALLISPSTPIGDYTRRISQRMKVVEFACVLYSGRFSDQPYLPDPVFDLLSFVAGYAQTATMPNDPELFLMQLSFLEATVDDPDQDTLQLENAALVAITYAMHDIEDIAAVNELINRDPDGVAARYAELTLKIRNDHDFEKRLSLRLIRYILKDFLQYLDDLNEDPDTRQHSCLEIVWPVLGIGAATLNHVQCMGLPGSDGESQAVNLQGQLAVILPSQWLLHDALALASERGEPIHPDYLPIIRQRMERVKEFPDMMIEPLKLSNIYRK